LDEWRNLKMAARPKSNRSLERSLQPPYPTTLITGSRPVRQASCFNRFCSYSHERSARSAGKASTSFALTQTRDVRAKAPSIAPQTSLATRIAGAQPLETTSFLTSMPCAPLGHREQPALDPGHDLRRGRLRGQERQVPVQPRHHPPRHLRHPRSRHGKRLAAPKTPLGLHRPAAPDQLARSLTIWDFALRTRRTSIDFAPL